MKKLKKIDREVIMLLINIISKRGKPSNNRLYADITCNNIAKLTYTCLRTAQKSIARLKAMGLIYIDKPHKSTMDMTNHYAINGELILLEHKDILPPSIAHKIHNILYSNNNITLSSNILLLPIGLDSSSTDVGDESYALDMAHDPSNDWGNNRIAVAVASEIEGLRVSRLQIRRLIACVRIKFSCLDNLKKYIRTVQQSDYYKRVVCKYKDPLNWLLSFAVINKVYAGGFGVFKRSKSDDSKKPNDQSSLSSGANDIPSDVADVAAATRTASDTHIEGLNESGRCKDYRRLVAKTHGEGVYQSYMTRVALVDRGDSIDIQGSSFIADYVNTHYLNDAIFRSDPEAQDFSWVERCEMRCC